MINSMTGFGRASAIFDTREITVEIKSVNHRYFDFSAKVPKLYGFLEEKLKSFIQASVSRGKVEVYVSVAYIEGANYKITVNNEIAESYISGLRDIAQRFGLSNDLSISALTAYNDIFSQKTEEQDSDALWEEVLEVAGESMKSFLAMREAEGRQLCDDMLSRIDFIEDALPRIDSLSLNSVSAYREKLYDRIREVLGDRTVDEGRLLTEVAIFSDKVAVAEETVRLRSHLKQFKDLLRSNEAVGRKLDFLIQEINREVNTIGSKSNEIEISRMVVDIKSEIEKIREQAQNME